MEDISTNNLWDNENIKDQDFRKLNNFYWFFSLDLKSSKKSFQIEDRHLPKLQERRYLS